MRNKLLIAAAATAVAVACIADGVEGMPGPLPTEETSTTDPSDDVIERTRTPMMGERPECDLLPADDSACAHACDHVALAKFIPAGTCATFECPLIDGSTYVTGACN